MLPTIGLPTRESGSEEDRSLRREIENAVRSIRNLPLMMGRIVTADFEAGVEKFVAHGLNRAPKGYITVMIDASVVLAIDKSKTDARYLSLTSPSACSAEIWVF